MLNYIKWFFTQEETIEATEEETIGVVEVARNEPTDTTFYYLNLFMNRLERKYNYMLMEELKDGTVITHLENASLEDVRNYCRMVWIPSHPAKFIFHAT